MSIMSVWFNVVVEIGGDIGSISVENIRIECVDEDDAIENGSVLANETAEKIATDWCRQRGHTIDGVVDAYDGDYSLVCLNPNIIINSMPNRPIFSEIYTPSAE